MRLENLSTQDPRRLLCERKYFGVRPQPLEQYLYRLNLSQCAERVFWLHWDAGLLRGDFTSEIAISEVARRVNATGSTVTRAYQALKLHGLIRRQDPGRDPSRPFCQATALTEIMLPRGAIEGLLSTPDRMSRASKAAGPVLMEPRKRDESLAPTAPIPSSEDGEGSTLVGLRAKFNGRASQAVFAKLTEDERADLFVAQRNAQSRQPHSWKPSPCTRLDTDEIRWLEDYLCRHGQTAPVLSVPQVNSNQVAIPKTSHRHLGTFLLAYLRKHLTQHVSGTAIDEKFREIVWAVEEGALVKYEPRFAMNIALKKLKEGAWTRPHRMPPNWRRAVA